MSEVAIRLRGLTKAYRLYRNSSDKALGIFNIRLGRFGAYTEHLAIDHIDLDIRRGERVGIIGRNGSGKSTLLKLISRTTAPSSGLLEVHGDIHVLMNLGTGFHPDFTGRQNAYAYLAQMGITGPRADALVGELATFAELGQYFDQPLMTYSSGMQVRLMFAASTVISPNILLLDEVLGVGDAYFVHKSFERLRRLCTREGTTLLLVTHSPHMAAEICGRLVWIDAGRVMMDGEPLAVISAYEASIRDQEEQRLRQVNQHLAQEAHLAGRPAAFGEGDVEASDAEGEAREAAALATIGGEVGLAERPPVAVPTASPGKGGRSAGREETLFLSAHLQTLADRVPRGHLYLSHFRLLSGDREVAVLDFAAPGRTVKAQVIDDPGKGDWSAPLRHDGRGARQYQRYGSVYHKLPLLIADPGLGGALPALTAEIAYWTDVPEQVGFSLYPADGSSRSFAVLDLSETHRWAVAAAALAPAPAAEPDDSARYGTRRIELVRFDIYGAEERETLLFQVGDPLRLRLHYRVNDPSLDERPAFIVGFHKDGLHSTHRWWTEAFRIAARHKAAGHLEVLASPLLLGPGKYTVTVAVFREGHITSPGVKKYFALSEHLYDMHARSRQIEVMARDGANPLYYDFIFQHPSRWRCDDEEAVSTFLGDHAAVDAKIYAPPETAARTRSTLTRPKAS